MGYKAISVITARGGSKGLPGKNIISLGGKPLIVYTIEASLGSRYINTTVVSTDYEDIRQIAIKYGAEAPFLRPAELATDTARSQEAVLHAVNFYERELKKSYDIIITLQPTSPLRTAQHIDEAVDKFLGDPTLDSLISIARQEHPPWWTFTLEGNRLRPLFERDKKLFNCGRQQYPVVYRPNGAIYITWKRYLEETGFIVNHENNGYYLMKPEDSIDIDTETDLYVAEAELAKRRK